MVSDQLLMYLSLRDLCLKEGPWTGSPGLTWLCAGSCPCPLDLAFWPVLYVTEFSRNPSSGTSGVSCFIPRVFPCQMGTVTPACAPPWDFCKE